MIEEKKRPQSRMLGAFLVLAGGSLAGCGQEVIPPVLGDPTQIVRVAAPPASDSVDASANYSVALRRGDGSGAGSETILFEATNAMVAAAGGTLGSSATVATGSDGVATAQVVLGSVVGSATIIASSTVYGFSDTLSLDVTAGAPDSATLSIDDMSVLVGESFVVTAVGVDRYGNPTSVVPTIASGALSVVDSTFTADHFGIGVLVAGAGTVQDSAEIRMVPDGEIVYTQGSVARTVRFDGSDLTTLPFSVPNVQESSIDWSPDAQRVVVGGFDGFRVHDLLTNTTLPAAWPGGTAGAGNVIWPRFGAVGDDRIYYSAQAPGGWDLRAADLDASNAEITIAAGVNPGNDLFPDWAPDGSRFVFTADWEQTNQFFLRLSDPDATTITTLFSAEAVTPKWSPDGSLIAWQELGQVGVVSPDETVFRGFNPGWSKGVTWSPDGTTLVGVAGGVITILDVVTGETMLFPELSSSADAVAWRPMPALMPSAEPTMTRWTAPAAAADSVDAEFDREYSVIVRGTDGRPIEGVTVDFVGANAAVAAVGGSFAASVGILTDANGVAITNVKLGTSAAAATVTASVDSLSVADTLAFTVLPGALQSDSIRFPLPDTTVVVGDTIDAAGATGFDRYGNPVTLTVEVGAGPLSGTGPFVADHFGSAELIATAGTIADTADVRIVPDGEIVMTDGSTAIVMSFDGSTADTLSFSVPTAQELSVDWNPAGTKIVVGSFDGFRVFDLGSEVTTPATWPGGTAGASVIWPRFGPAGNRVYYSSSAPGGWDLREADLDATDAAITIAAGVNSGNDLFPDWAPDSSAFVFTADWEQTNQFFLRVSNPDASVVNTLSTAEGVTPVWSPDGTLIGWQELGLVGVVSPDETVLRTWNTGWSKGVAWSPDSSTLVGLAAGVIEVTDVVTGETMAFPELGNGFDAVSWRPN